MRIDMTKGLIALPPTRNRLIPDAQNTAWDNLGPRAVKGFVLHRMLGTLDGTDEYFRGMGGAHDHYLATGEAIGALTDYGQDAVTGVVYQWNNPTGAAHPGVSPNRAGWASGPFNVHGDAYGDGLAFVRKYGIAAVNRDEVSWEIDGMYDSPWSEKAMGVAARACAHYAHDYGIPYYSFPIIPRDGFSFLRYHKEICGPAEKACPGKVVVEQIDIFIAKVVEILQLGQLSGRDRTEVEDVAA